METFPNTGSTSIKIGDMATRIAFANWFSDACNRDRCFLSTFIIGNEGGFSMNGCVNTQDVRDYAFFTFSTCSLFEDSIGQP